MRDNTPGLKRVRSWKTTWPELFLSKPSKIVLVCSLGLEHVHCPASLAGRRHAFDWGIRSLSDGLRDRWLLILHFFDL